MAPSVQGRACPLTQPTSPARLGTVWVRAPRGPTLNSLRVFTTLRPSSPPCDFKQPGLSRGCSSLVWQGREPLVWLSPRSPVAGPVGAGLGLQLPWSLSWSQGPFCPEAVPLLSVFSVSSILLVCYLHKRLGTVSCLLCSSVDWVGVSPMCRGK